MPGGKPRIDQGEDGLLVWCAGRLERVRRPRAARELVDEWYSHWFGKAGKPRSCYRDRRGQFKTHHTDRVTKWIQRQVAQGTLVHIDNAGPRGTGRYRLVEGKRLTGPRRKPGPDLLEESSDAFPPNSL